MSDSSIGVEFVGVADLGVDFDQGTQQSGKINVVNATTGAAGKMRFATPNEIAAATAGVGIDAATFGKSLPLLANVSITDSFNVAIGSLFAVNSGLAPSAFSLIALGNLDSVFDIGNLTANKISVSTFVGANGSMGGARGLVPAPTPTQSRTYSLRGDATWQPALSLAANGGLQLSYDLRGNTEQQPNSLLQITGGNTLDAMVEVDTFGGVARFAGLRADGILGSPSALSTGEQISSFETWGYNGTVYQGPTAALRAYTAEGWTETASGTYLRFAVTKAGTNILLDAVGIDSNGAVLVPPTVTGGNKGIGTLNASGLYVNGSAVATLNAQGQLDSSQIPASLVGSVNYQGNWNASTNTPTLASGTGTKGFYYIVSIAGTTSIDGNAQWDVGDWIIFDGTHWDQLLGNQLPPSAVLLTATQAITNKTYNGLSITTTNGTFTVDDSKVFRVSNSLTLTGTDNATINLSSLAGLGTNNSWTGTQLFSAATTFTGASYFDYTSVAKPTVNAGLAITISFSGKNEVNLWNTDTTYQQGFNFWQMTGAGAGVNIASLSSVSGTTDFTLDPAGTKVNFHATSVGVSLNVNSTLIWDWGITYSNYFTISRNAAIAGILDGVQSAGPRVDGSASASATSSTIKPNRTNSIAGIGAYAAGGLSLIVDKAGAAYEAGRFDTTGMFTAFGKIAVNQSNLGSVALDVFSSAAGTLATFQSNGTVDHGTVFSVGSGAAGLTNVTLVSATASTSQSVYVNLQQNGAGNATYLITVLGVGDTSIRYINPSATWTNGVDQSDSSKFKVSYGGALGTTDCLAIDTSGQTTISALAGFTGSILSVTGTWNSSSVYPGALLVNITNTQSGVGSLLVDFQLNGSTLWKLASGGTFFAQSGYLQAGTESTSVGSGALTVLGGVSVGKTLNVGNAINLVNNQAATTAISITNTTSASPANTRITFINSFGSNGSIILYSTNSPSGLLLTDSLHVAASGTGGLVLRTTVAASILFGINNAQVGSIDASGLEGMAIGVNTQASGSFTTLNSSGLATLASLTVSGVVKFSSLSGGAASIGLGLDSAGNVVTSALGGGGNGTVTSGTANQLAYYPANAAQVDGTSNIYVSATGGLSVGSTTGTDYTINWTGLFVNNQNAITHLGLNNNVVGTSAGTWLHLIGGTANSYLQIQHNDNNGAPFSVINIGAGVSGGLRIDTSSATASALTLKGGSAGVIVSNTGDATSSTVGGALTVDGGLAVAKSLYVGSSIFTNAGLTALGTIISGNGSANTAIKVLGNTAATMSLESAGGGTDAKYWDIYSNTSVFTVRALNDGYSASNIALQINRGTGYAITSVQFPQGTLVVGASNIASVLRIFSSGGGYVTIQTASTISGTTFLTLPNFSASLVGDTSTQTLTNKTLTAPSISTPVFTGLTTGVPVNGLGVDASGNLILAPWISLTATDQLISGGANVTSSNLGTGSGTVTIDCGLCPLQYIINNGAFTLAAPALDGSCLLQITNGASAGTITFSGFTVASTTGSLDTTSGHVFTLSIYRINGKSGYIVIAQQG